MTKINSINQTTLVLINNLLKQGKNIDIASTLITIIAIVICCIPLLLQKTAFIGTSGLFAMLVFCLWLIQKYYAIRISIDMNLFAYLAIHSQSANERINELDDCLTHLKLKKKANHNWSERQRGALNLIKKQIVFFAGQVILFLILLANLFFNP